jgi:hypothetical protein
MMINATEMAKIYSKEVARFMENDSTKKFIESCLKTRNSSYLNIKSEEDLVVSKQKSGTYMHRVFALKFASWLNPDFELWVYSTIETILFGKHVERERSLERSIELQAEMDVIRFKAEKTGEDFERYLVLETEARREKALRQAMTRRTVSEMSDLFTFQTQEDK